MVNDEEAKKEAWRQQKRRLDETQANKIKQLEAENAELKLALEEVLIDFSLVSLDILAEKMNKDVPIDERMKMAIEMKDESIQGYLTKAKAELSRERERD
jgi:hypothetical protein